MPPTWRRPSRSGESSPGPTAAAAQSSTSPRIRPSGQYAAHCPTTAKAAIEGLTHALAVDHGPRGIRTNAVALGSISTPRYETYRHDHPDVDVHIAALHPLGRVGTASEVADVVSFLLSPAAGFSNGVILPVDGGRAADGADLEAT